MRQFTGLCLGGPKDGYVVTMESERYRVPIQPDVPAYSFPREQPEENPSINVMTYHYVQLLGAGFWVPEPAASYPIGNNQVVEYVIKQLTTNYKASS